LRGTSKESIAVLPNVKPHRSRQLPGVCIEGEFGCGSPILA
jgi:hypothetical protein